MIYALLIIAAMFYWLLGFIIVNWFYFCSPYFVSAPKLILLPFVWPLLLLAILIACWLNPE